MDQAVCALIVEGDWAQFSSRTVKNKLKLYFGNERKSSGGVCRVDGDGAPNFSVFFSCEDVRQRVLNRQNHEITVNDQIIKLRLSSAASPASGENVSAPPAEPEPEIQPGAPASAANRDEPVLSAAVLLDHVADDMSELLLAMVVESILDIDENDYIPEIIWEISSAVIAFKDPAVATAFLTAGTSSNKLQRHGLTARRLEVTKSIRVENLPPTETVKAVLDLYFEKWARPDDIVMIPAEQAAIITFKDARVVERICQRHDHVLRSISIKVYPYYESLGTALYGKDRPKWKMPEPFTETVHHIIWRFLEMKKLFETINDQMSPYFCNVDLSNSDVKLSPVRSFLRQNGLTAERVAMWGNTAKDAFHKQMSQYTAFECTVSTPAWKAAQTDVRAVVQEDAILVMDASRDILIVAGQDDDMKRIKAPVEKIVCKAMNLIKRQSEGVEEKMPLSPAMFYILNQEGLQKAAQDISPDMHLSYDDGIQMLTIVGLPAEVYQAKSWILERKVPMIKKAIEVSPGLLGFLQTVDAMDMSQHLFTSQSISAIYTIEINRVLLLGSSDRVLADAESKMMKALSVQTLDVEDPEVLKLQTWTSLTQHLLDSYNSSKKKTVSIHPDGSDKITVAGFLNPVKEVSENLKEFIVNYAQIQETIRAKSCAVVQFINRKKTQQWSSIAKSYEVTVQFDEERPKIIIAGARLHVQQSRSLFQELINALSTDNFTVDKPGAKKYFMSHGRVFLSTIMSELSCMVVLCSENQVEEEEEDFEDNSDVCYCNVQTTHGVLVSVSRANICNFRVDAVVNAANEDLQHIGGLALALLKAAGPDLQRLSNDQVAKHGKLRAGDAVITDACKLPSKFVVHAVGPRYSDYDRMAAVSYLKRAIKSSLRQAERANCSTIALPAISSGVFGFPVDLCADTIAQAVREYCDSPGSSRLLAEIHLVDNNHDTVKVLATAIDREFSDLEPVLTIPQPGASRLPQGRSRSHPLRNRQANRGGPAPVAPVGYTRPVGDGGPRSMEQTTAEGLKIALQKGNIQDQTTAVIVNTIADNMNLDQGAVSKAILNAAGSNLQSAVLAEARVAKLQFGDVVITKGFGLRSRKIFHAVCPFWDNGAGPAEQNLTSIVRFCLEEAEKLQMPSLSIPAIGTGNLSFPRDVVSRVLLAEIRSFSGRKRPQYLREVAIVVHPSDSRTVECFSRDFGARPAPRHFQNQEFAEAAGGPASQQPPQASASFGQVTSPALGVYQMQMGQLTLEVLTGDITREACDVIINSSNQNFTLQSGVSQAILAGAGPRVQQECAQIVNSPGYQPRSMIMTSAGSLPSRNIIHVVGQNDPAKIKDTVYSVLKLCETNGSGSVAFPALGTGQGGASPSAVADAMVDAVVEFVRKKQPQSVSSVKFLIFQAVMVPEFHKSMKKREGQIVQEKSVFTRVKDAITSFFTGSVEERPSAEFLVLEKEEFEPTVFQLCADSDKAVSQAKQRITELIVAEQAQRSISDTYIHHLTQADMDQLRDLQKQLTVSIRLDKGQDDQEPTIHLEGLTRDVFTAESSVRDIIRKVERKEIYRNRAQLLSGLVEWQIQHPNGSMVPVDIETNLSLEEALEKKQKVKIKILGETFIADVVMKSATSVNGHKQLELSRKDLKDDAALPSNWDDMKGDNSKYLYTVAAASAEYKEVEKEMNKTGLQANILSIERVQNAMMWQSYQLKKKELDKKNKHKNNERRLFHGTGANAIALINKQGFNRSYAGQHAAMYGKGSYFAVDPIYSARGYAHPDTKGHKRMYLARVLVGDYTKGNANMITPPSKNAANTADLYDSVTDNAANPTMFIVFNDIQAYPEYLITFT